MNDYIVTKKFDVRLILSHRLKIDDFAELYDKFDKRVPGLLKTFVETRFSGQSTTARTAFKLIAPARRPAKGRLPKDG